MIKIVAIGIWVCIVSLGSSYMMASFSAPHAKETEAASYFDGLDYKKVDPITVPIIADNEVKGYILARFIYTIDGKAAASLAVPPDPFILDEAFRAIYSTVGFDFQRPERYDIAKLTKSIKEAINARYKTALLDDVLVEQFDYIDKRDVQRQG
ncbi:hypothetical protein [Mangrovicella endophytica]|uniref:hypothetical protein n=1 Tax=Mangrovicella endophytica TaxID=2066697 RepID=UPI000C9DFD19|nr:hypothetical protein [Mangrovicella endophytica]